MAASIVEAWGCRYRKYGKLDIGVMSVSTVEVSQYSPRRHVCVDSKSMAMLTSERYRSVDSGAILTEEVWECRQQRHRSINSRGIGVSIAEVWEYHQRSTINMGSMVVSIRKVSQHQHGRHSNAHFGGMAVRYRRHNRVEIAGMVLLPTEAW
ncbi:hypothetical protein EV426DRAFT_701699 [Tirmania nivea]|nr:hypothetical protein EV426DRAFT_701699 [Tirmania nivea]